MSITWTEIPCDVWIHHVFSMWNHFQPHSLATVEAHLSWLVNHCTRWAKANFRSKNEYKIYLDAFEATTNVYEQYRCLQSIWRLCPPEYHYNNFFIDHPISVWNAKVTEYNETMVWSHLQTGKCHHCYKKRDLIWLPLRLVCRTWNAWIMGTAKLWEQLFELENTNATDADWKRLQEIPSAERGTYVLRQVIARKNR